jgi:hypothetical protein
MPLYTVRLESQTDSQWRERNITASDEKHAAKLAEAREGAGDRRARRCAHGGRDDADDDGRHVV